MLRSRDRSYCDQPRVGVVQGEECGVKRCGLFQIVVGLARARDAISHPTRDARSHLRDLELIAQATHEPPRTGIFFGEKGALERMEIFSRIRKLVLYLGHVRPFPWQDGWT
jgi:hypothetical protein